MLGKATILCCCVTLAASGLALSADQPIDFSREAIAKAAPAIAAQLRSANPSDRQNALEIIHKVAQTSSRILSDNLSSWTDALIENENYDDVLNLTMIAITDRSFDTATVEKLQEARVRALIGQQKLEQALAEAKSYYNVCVLASTPYSIDLMRNILDRQGKSPVGSRLLFEQTRAPATQPIDPPLEPLDGGLPLSLTVLKSIKIDPSLWQDALDHAGGHSLNNAMSRGNVDLEMDRPDDARKEFELAVELSDGASSSKNMREAVEGIARSIRTKQGSAEPANAFILSMREDPGKVIATKIQPEKLREVARQVTLAPVKTMAVPALEEKRAEQEAKSDPTAANISIATGFEGASSIRPQRVDPTQFRVVLMPQLATLCDWFLFRIDGAKGQTVRIDLIAPYAPLDRWWTLNPVWCDAADYEHPDSPGKDASAARVTGVPPVREVSSTGETPVTQLPSAAIPDTSDQSWHYIPDAWRSDPQTFSFVHTFTSNRVYVGMRIPDPPTQNERFLSDLTSSSKDVELIKVGKSRHGRPLLMAQVASGDLKSKPCVLIYAGEHADEPDGMWAARGAIEFLASDSPEAKQLRDHFTFLVIPQLDPDSTANGVHEGVNTTFLNEVKSPESIAYANWFQSWVNAGNRLDLVFDLHNMQSSEMGHVQCWLMEGLAQRGELALSVHREVFQQIASAGFTMTTTPTQRGWSPDRLGGWLARRYGPLSFLYELNSQAAERHLTLNDLKHIGAGFVRGAGKYLESADAARLLTMVDGARKQRETRWGGKQDLLKGMDAIEAEATISQGVGIAAAAASGSTAEKWIP